MPGLAVKKTLVRMQAAQCFSGIQWWAEKEAFSAIFLATG